MQIIYKKSKIYTDYYIIYCLDGSVNAILDFYLAKLYFHIPKESFINIMKNYNGVNQGLSYNMNGSVYGGFMNRREFDYMFFANEADVKNAVEFLERALIIVKLMEG